MESTVGKHQHKFYLFNSATLNPSHTHQDTLTYPSRKHTGVTNNINGVFVPFRRVDEGTYTTPGPCY